jgi:ATP-dependent RNA helicase RhlE
MTDFSGLGLSDTLQQAVAAAGYTIPTPIQAQAIPRLMEGRDLLGLAQTGTGKTAAFALPILNRITGERRRASSKSARVLVLTPTRELASQIADSFKTLAGPLPLRHALIFGGVGAVPQMRAMSPGVDVLVATPGRLLDLMNQGAVDLRSVEVFVLDEADRMLDMGFIRDVRKIVSRLPSQRQTLLFSATMPDEIADLAGSLLNDPVRVEVTPQATTVERIDQQVMFVEMSAKRALLVDRLADPAVARAIVFTRTKHGANRVAEHLEKAGVAAEAIHGNKSQSARERALDGFRGGRVRILVATDIAARGIDVDGVTHVINFDMPVEPESYVHRIGRTARAGRDGVAWSFCAAEELQQLRAIERTIRKGVPVSADHPFHATEVARRHGSSSAGRPSGGGSFANGPSGNGARSSQGRGHGRPGGAPQPRPMGAAPMGAAPLGAAPASPGPQRAAPVSRPAQPVRQPAAANTNAGAAPPKRRPPITFG